VPENGNMKVSPEEAKSLSEKLKVFRETLTPGEQQALDTTLKVFEDRVSSEPRAQALLADFPESARILEDVAGFRQDAPGEDEIVWTTVTVVTVAGSHPWITC
jgi:hypothetical protein